VEGEHEPTTISSDSVRWFETVVSAISIALLTNGPSVAISHLYNVPLGWERWPYVIPIGAVALLGMFMSGRDLNINRLRRSFLPLALLIAYLLWSTASVTWSVAPDASAIRILITTGVSAFGVWWAIHLAFREQVLSVFLATSALSLWSLGLILLQPRTHQLYPPSSHPGFHTQAFGVFGNPNSLGPVATLSALSAIAVWVLFRSWSIRITTALIALVGVLLTVWSRCETAIASLGLSLIAIGAATALPTVRRRCSGWVVGGSLVALSALLWRVFFDHIRRIAPLIGSDEFLSSRRLIWQDVRSAISLRPWRGYGFFAFWDSDTATASTYQRLESAYGSAHNSVLEVALGLGRIGLILYIALAVTTVVGMARAVWFRTSLVTLSWLVVIVVLVTQNSMESFVLWHSYLWALFVGAAVASTQVPGVRRPDVPDATSYEPGVAGRLVETPDRGRYVKPSEVLARRVVNRP
jgi:O-antigen ligase